MTLWHNNITLFKNILELLSLMAVLRLGNVLQYDFQFAFKLKFKEHIGATLPVLTGWTSHFWTWRDEVPSLYTHHFCCQFEVVTSNFICSHNHGNKLFSFCVLTKKMIHGSTNSPSSTLYEVFLGTHWEWRMISRVSFLIHW